MRFLIRKRRTAPAVIIVALIDVLIVLVIFLLVTTTFKQQQPSLQLTLPESSSALKPGGNDNPPLVVIIEANGVVRLGPEALPMTVENLIEQLKQRAAQNPNLKLAVRADKSAPWGQMVKVMDAAKAAHIKLMSAYTKETGKP